MKYERLTDKDWHKEKFYCHSNSERTVIKRLFDLENKIEQGTLIELPCKVGDSFFGIVCWGVREYEIDYIKIYKNKIRLVSTDNIGFDLGEDCFLTEEEAKKKLKELQNG